MAAGVFASEELTSGARSTAAPPSITRPTNNRWSPAGSSVFKLAIRPGHYVSVKDRHSGRARGPRHAGELVSPRAAKRFETSAASAWRMLTANRPAAVNDGRVWLVSATLTSNSGGSAGTLQTAVEVKPTGQPSASTVVTTVTPLGNEPMIPKNACLSICTEPPRSRRRRVVEPTRPTAR